MSSGDQPSSAGSTIDTDGGASGTSGGFNLSRGGLIAIIIVVVVVVVLGTASTVLFVIAKRRQWDVRASIKRASRRITGRGGGAQKADRQSKRAALQLDTRPARLGHKRGLVVEVRDVEKGQAGREAGAKQSAKQDKRAMGDNWG